MNAGAVTGAWQRWRYVVEVFSGPDDTGTIVRNLSDIVSTNVTVLNLMPSHQYAFRVRAYSYAGEGPWSNVFSSVTLPAGMSLLYSLLHWICVVLTVDS